MDILREKKLKSTRPRKEILVVFEAGHALLSAEDIFNKVKKKGIDPVTVYRTLQAFEKKGIIKKVDVRRAADYYELADHHHHHIVCIKCKTVESFEYCGMQGISKKILSGSKKFSTISDHAFEFFGVCKSCVKK